MKSNSLKSRILAASKVLQNITESTAAQQETLALWSDPNFIAWLQQHGVGVHLGVAPTKYADGGVGRAYFIGDKVVKFTDNRVEGNVANMVAGNPKTPTRIIGVYRFKPKALWAILQKKLNMDVPKMVKKASDLLMAYVDETGIEEFPQDNKSRIEMAQHCITMFEESQELVPFILEVIETLDALYRNTGFFHDDAGPTNIGMDADKIALPDLGPNQTGNFNARKALDKIHDKRAKLGLPPYREI